MSTQVMAALPGLDLRLDFPPWKLSGVVVAAAINDPQLLAALGEAVHAAPYKAPPRGPVLHVKPRNTLRASGSELSVPSDVDCFELGATLGLIVGRAACGVSAANALTCVAGWVMAADLSVPHASCYRPAARFKARDGSCFLGLPVPAGADPDADPDTVTLNVEVDGVLQQRVSMAGLLRPASQLIADVSEFMTLNPGDVLLMGVRMGAPRVGAGQRFAVHAGPAQGLGRLEGRLVTLQESA